MLVLWINAFSFDVNKQDNIYAYAICIECLTLRKLHYNKKVITDQWA